MNSGLLSRYRNGCKDAVWSELAAVNFSELTEVEQAETRTIIRDAMVLAQRNVRLMVREIQKQTTYALESDRSRSKGAIEDLVELVRPFGFLPHTFLEFYKTMSGVNLSMDDRFRKDYPYSDPLYVDTVENVLDICGDGGWKEMMEENEHEGLPVYLYISPDRYHKDHASGGEGYGIEITRVQKIDGRIFNTPYGELSLIQYMNTCFRSAGFPGIKERNPFVGVVTQLNTI